MRRLTLAARGWKKYSWEDQERLCQKYEIILVGHMTRNERVRATLSGIGKAVKTRHQKNTKNRKNFRASLKKFLESNDTKSKPRKSKSRRVEADPGLHDAKLFSSKRPRMFSSRKPRLF